MSMKNAVVGVIVALGVVVAVLTVIGALNKPVVYHGTHLAPASPEMPFTLRSAEGPVTLDDLKGKATVLFFGYTSCPDVCPTTLLQLSTALDHLGEDREDVHVVFVSVDPERDTPERTTAYARAVDPSFLGVTGTDAEIAHVTSRYGIYYAKAEGSEATGYLVDHSATVLVLNPDGQLELLWSPTVTAPQMAEDLDSLLSSRS
jgi:protein SCO1/2